MVRRFFHWVALRMCRLNSEPELATPNSLRTMRSAASGGLEQLCMAARCSASYHACSHAVAIAQPCGELQSLAGGSPFKVVPVAICAEQLAKAEASLRVFRQHTK